MPYMDDRTAPSLHIALFQFFKCIASLARYLPGGLVNPLFVGLRFLFVAVLGFAAWVRSFSDSSVGLWIAIGFVLCTLIHSYFGRQCLYPEDGCKLESEKDELTKQWLKNEMTVGKDIHEKLEEVLANQENKVRLEKEAQNIIDYWKTEVARSEDRADNLQQQIEELLKEKSDLSDQLEEKSDENLTIRTKFHENLSMLNDTVESLKNVEKAKNGLEDLVSIEKIQRLEHENSMLKAAVEVLTQQRKSLEEKHSVAMGQINELLDLKKVLEDRLLQKDALENLEKEKLEEVHKLTEKLASSLMTAKGRLSKTQSTLLSLPEKPNASSLSKPTKVVKT